uniref:RRM domain-containing protein n=1 Tax=Leptobrachium leishanense TaxID=445787 RepID=A0A8C5R641_9ANUR
MRVIGSCSGFSGVFEGLIQMFLRVFGVHSPGFCQVQPVYLPAPAVKRKLPEELGTSSDGPSKAKTQTVSLEPAKNPKRSQSESDKKVADRESGLTNADKQEENSSKVKVKDKAKKVLDFEESAALRVKKKINKRAEAAKNKRTVFVGNLPASFTKQALKSLFKEFGFIETMRFRSVARADNKVTRKAATIQRDVHPKRNNINAYVVFKEEESAAKALKKNGMEVASGVCIRVDLAAKSTSHDNKRSAFVGNLPYEIQEDALRQHFLQCGKVEAVRLIRDKDTGLGKGFGYVLFESKDAVQLALKLNNTKLMGRDLRVKRCITGDSAGKNPAKKSFKPKYVTPKSANLPKSNTFVGETADFGKNKMKKKSNPKPKKGKSGGKNRKAK